MKIYLTCLFFIIGGGFASATVQNQADPDKPATIEMTRTAWNQNGKFLAPEEQATWTYEGQWSAASGGYVQNQNGENGPEGNASVTGDYYSIDTNGNAISGYSFWQANGCGDSPDDESGTNALSPDQLQAQMVSMRKGTLSAGANIDPGCEWPSNFIPIYYENDSADCTVMLHTGGKSTINRQNLFAISGSATAITAPCDYWGVWAGSSNVPPTSIQILGQSLGTDGNLYITLPDNADFDVTPKAPVPYYNFNVGATKYHPYITANGADLDCQTPTNCVGQQVNFMLLGLPISQIVNMVGKWNLPGSCVNEAYQYPQDCLYSSQCSTYTNDPTLLENTNATSCWFQDKPGGTVSVGMDLLFVNGQTAAVAADGTVNVVKPSILSSNELFGSSFNTNGPPSGPEAWVNLSVSVQVQPPPQFSGQCTFVQLVQRQAQWYVLELGACVPPILPDSTGGQFWLDGSDPYPDNTCYVSWNENPLPFAQHTDSPGFGPSLCTSLNGSDEFKTYLQFQPNTVGSIPVTIGRIDWGWSYTAAEYSGGTWGWDLPTWGPIYNWNDDSFPVWQCTYPVKGL